MIKVRANRYGASRFGGQTPAGVLTKVSRASVSLIDLRLHVDTEADFDKL